MSGMTIMKKINVMFFGALFFLIPAELLFAAVGCDLNDPDRDVARLFPSTVSHKFCP
jgi:hypothetical protein